MIGREKSGSMRAPLLMLGVPVVATLTGGLMAMRFQRFRPVLVALGAGLLLGAAFLDLLPEAIASRPGFFFA